MRIAIIGFGVVGQGLVEILQDKRETLRQQHTLDVQIVAVCDTAKGSVYHPQGLDAALSLQAVQSTGSLDSYPDVAGLVRGLDSLSTIRDTEADVIVETTWTDLETGEPAITHIRTAFQAGKHVVTSNKGPVALAYKELKALADAKGLLWGIEGTVMSGTPALRLGTTALAGCTIRAVRGILNGTTNFILTRMEDGATYAEALAEAQRLGYAEADPTADVEGYDALGKLLILAAVVLGHPVSARQVSRQGITHLTPQDIQRAKAQGKRWKLIAELQCTDDGVQARVAPQLVELSHPLAGVSGATNAITYITDLLGEVTLIGPGAGRRETGFALLADLLDIHRAIQRR
ncbi:MAG: homoserine dehydrogenase [Anaerolineae bacterium]|nr:homoserine dehydrogenase [Anaerolineae bacterium]MDW8070687.1 homoserine dehydrogenase [Anaerolineae bacterium]